MDVRDWLIGCGIKPNRDLENALESALQLQRKWCADAIDKKDSELTDRGWEGSHSWCWDEVLDACLNATGEDYGCR